LKRIPRLNIPQGPPPPLPAAGVTQAATPPTATPPPSAAPAPTPVSQPLAAQFKPTAR
jgi:hypothetical protein